MPITFNPEAFLDGSRTATLAPATTEDRARLTDDGDWIALDDLPIGSEIVEVNHYGQHTTKQGSTISMKSIETQQRYDLIVTRIHLVRCSDLAPDELRRLGYETRADFDASFGSLLGSRRAWFIEVMPTTDHTPI